MPDPDEHRERAGPAGLVPEVQREDTLGQIVANNIAVDALTDPVPPPFGKSEGIADNGGRKWKWVRTATRTADVRIVRIDVSVADENGRPGAALSFARVIQ